MLNRRKLGSVDDDVVSSHFSIMNFAINVWLQENITGSNSSSAKFKFAKDRLELNYSDVV